MEGERYCIGIDYGTLSARAVVVDVRNGSVSASAVYPYPHGVMDACLPDGTALKPGWALQHPKDYKDALKAVIPEAVREARIDPGKVIGIGVDCTSSTVFPADMNGEPLCFKPEYEHRPQAYMKLWKHHGAQAQADRMTELAVERGEAWLERYGGRINSELALPKLLETLEEDPELYSDIYEWTEAVDYLTFCLTGVRMRSESCAAYKSLYVRGKGYPSEDYFGGLDPRFKHVIRDKYRTPPAPIGGKAGTLSAEMASELGLRPGIAVGVGTIDAHTSAPAAGMSKPGQLLLVFGTSIGHHLLSDRLADSLTGMFGVVEGGMIPGCYDYECGQTAVGDMFDWFCRRCVPGQYERQAEQAGMGIQPYLTFLAEKLYPGESGLVALDWWNGNRSILSDSGLTGLILGLTLRTRPEEIYLALLEATAYGTRVITDQYEKLGLPITECFASGGISRKNALAMQIYADVLNRPVAVIGTDQASAVGAAIFAAAAAGEEAGGYGNVHEAAEAMKQPPSCVYQPKPDRVKAYDKLYAEYHALYDWFGRGGNDVMHRLGSGA